MKITILTSTIAAAFLYVGTASAIPYNHGIADKHEARPIQEDYGTKWANHILSPYIWQK